MRFELLSCAARTIWAKSGENGGHGLLAHMLDVAAVAEQILQREPPSTVAGVAAVFGLAEDSAARTFAAWVGLHDLGKAIPGFQNKWPAGRAADEAEGLDFSAPLLQFDRHDMASAFELQRLLRTRFGDIAAAIAGAVAAHHGHFFTSRQIAEARRPFEPPAWAAARAEILAAYLGTLCPAPGTPEGQAVPTLPALAWLAGLTSVSDWIGSNPDWFPLGERAASLADHHARSLDLADTALDWIGWPKHRRLLAKAADTDALIGQIIGMPGLGARPLQSAADDLLQSVKAPALLIVEAPMGEGKTELALLAHIRLQARLGHRGFYLAMPTQATGNAMFERALHFLRSFADDQRLDLQLAHGGAVFDERLVELRGIHGTAGERVRSSAWFSQRKRALISPYGVGTIDQALFGTLNVQHHFVRLWGLSNRLVVLDEVHAYDTYTGGLIEALLRWLKPLGCSVVLMSATLPRHKRLALLRSWGANPSAVPDLPYPRLLLTSAGESRGATFASREQAPIRLDALAEDLESIAELAVELVAKGGCGAVIVNTVDRAQKLYLLLKLRMNEPQSLMLFHARYPMDERIERERAVLGAFGKDGQRPARALLIATQVVEQSLDIDFDFLMTDLAPVDLLLQRAGRLHRHERNRPQAHRDAVLWVAGLLATRLPELKHTAWGAVCDPFILCRTWAFVSRESELTLPKDIDRLVQLVYGDDELPGHVDAAARDFIEGEAWGDHCARKQTETQFARNAAVDADDDPQNAYAGKPGSEEGSGLGASNQTRLGDASVTVLPVHVARDGWRLHADQDPFDPTQKPDPALARRMLGRQLRLSRKAVVMALREEELPAGFEEHPWLADVKPLRLQNGALSIGNLRVALDPELGVVYCTDDKPAATTKELTP